MELKGKFLTVIDMAKELNEEIETVKKRLTRKGIKPVSRDALYEATALEAIRNVPGKGRPKKAAEQNNPESKAKK